MQAILILIFLVVAPVAHANLEEALFEGTKCADMLAEMTLDPAEKFALTVARKFQKSHKLPKANSRTYKNIQWVGVEVAGLKPENARRFREILETYGLAFEDWRRIEQIKVEGVALGTIEFREALEEMGLEAEDEKALLAVHKAAAAALARVQKTLFAIEEEYFVERKRFLNEDEIKYILQLYTGESQFGLKHLGYDSVTAFRHAFMARKSSFEKKVVRVVISSFIELTKKKNQILEDKEEISERLAKTMGISPGELDDFFGEGKVFGSIQEMVDMAKEARSGSFKKVIDRRIFTDEKQQAMLDAVRDSNDIIVFKLAENQDLKDFEAVRLLSKSLGDAPIIVAPAFTEIGLVPEKLGWLFNEPNVHFMVDRGIQITRGFYVVDHGFHDKYINPIPGLKKLYKPGERVLLFHPRVLSETRPSGNYDTHPGFIMTTGSMSDPAYWGNWNMSMNTDDKAQLEAEMNRSVTVLSRRYRNPKLDGFLESAQGIAPRRVRHTDALYGNPAGLFDLGKIYSNEGVVDVDAIPALVLGDIHLGITDPGFLKATKEMLLSLNILEKNPDFEAGQFAREYREGPVKLGAIVLHDLVDGTPNNHHTLDRLITRAGQDRRGELDLESHFQMAAAWLKQHCALLPDTKIVVPMDNHGSDWLKNKLQSGELQKGHRPKELPIILQHMLDAINTGDDPYKRMFQYLGVDTDQVIFMDSADNFRVGVEMDKNSGRFQLIQGVELGLHGQMGESGARSISLKKMLEAYGPSVSGHYHTSAEHAQAVRVGTGTPVRQDYHRGPGKNDASVALVYGETAIQLLRMERGSFVPNSEGQPPEEFFPNEEFPRLEIRKLPPGGHTSDQYRANPPSEAKRRN